MHQHLAVYGGQRLGKRNAFRTSLHAILRIVAISDSAGQHKRVETLRGMHRARGMHVEEAHLADNCSADERIPLIDLGANLQTISTSDAARKWVALFLHRGRHARAFADVIRAVYRNPTVSALQVFKHFERSTTRSRTSGNFVSGSRLIGFSSSSTRAVQACRAVPLISMAQAPQTSSRQFAS